MTDRYGATPEEWRQWAAIAPDDLLPVVSRPGAEVSSRSGVSAVGKVPTVYTVEGGRRVVVGIPRWTTKQSTPQAVEHWAAEPDYGICVQTRRVRALDIDVEDADIVAAILDVIRARVGPVPVRTRGTARALVPLIMTGGAVYKRRLKVSGGVVELLGDGSQFVAAGTHPSGARYVWEGLADGVPEVTAEKLDDLWTELALVFGVEAAEVSGAAKRTEQLAAAIERDPIAQHLIAHGWVRKAQPDRLHVRCPFEHEHTSPSTVGSTTYFPAHTGGFENGHFVCLHAHCAGRTNADFLGAVGYTEAALLDGMPDETGQEEPPREEQRPSRLLVRSVADVVAAPVTGYHVKGLLPRCELVVMYGGPGSGKSFLALDLAGAIVRGEPWRELKVTQGRVLYVAAEGGIGVGKRLSAYLRHNNLDPDALADLLVITDAPRLLDADDVVLLSRRAEEAGGVDMIIIDTLARSFAGGDENDAADMGVLIKHAQALHRRTGATVLFVHHSGKDAARGARGHSSLLGATDVELRVARGETCRELAVTKAKDWRDGDVFYFDLLPIEVDVDEDGDAVTSCVIEHLDEPPERAETYRPRTPAERVLLGVLEDYRLAGGTAGVDEVVDSAAAKLLVPPDEQKRRVAVMKALQEMATRGLVALDSGQIFLYN